MGKHKFNSGRICEFCAGDANSLARDENGRFNPCPDAPDGGNNILYLSIYVSSDSI
jgi:hypothetical protein